MNTSATQTFWRLLAFTLPFRGKVFFSVLLGTLTIGSSIGLMATSAWLISKAGLRPGIEELSLAVVGVRFFGISRAVFRYAERLVTHDLTFRLLASIRVWFYKGLEPLAPARLTQYRSGELLGRVVSDVESLQEFYVRVVAPPLVALISIVIMSALFAAFDLLAAIIIALTMLSAAIILPLFAWWRTQNPGQAMIQARSELHSTLVESIQGLPEAMLYGYSDRQLQQLEKENNKLRTEENKLAGFDSIQIALGLFFTHASAILMLLVMIPRIDPIYLATMVLATVAAFEAITPLGAAATHWGSSLAAGRNVFEVVDQEAEAHIGTVKQQLSTTPYLEIQHLSFAYEAEQAAAIKDLSLSLATGERKAIVGPSGAGKSSIINLLLRFWEAPGDAIRIDGQALATYDAELLRANIAVMSQRTHLFNTSLLENIAIARSDASEADVIEAAKQAQIHDFITQLPEGYQSFAGEGGVLLSGGEKQRIALARALLKDAPILILDEATANLDTITEQAVLEQVYRLSSKRALLVITHRLTMLDQMDEIIVMKAGEVIERGTEAVLLAQDSYYRRMWSLQRQSF